MNTPAPEPKPKRSRRMVVWMVAMPIAILLLALAGANWKRFHLAYAKHLISSDDTMKQYRGVQIVLETHLRKGMTLEEVRAILAPARVSESELSFLDQSPPIRQFVVDTEGDPSNYTAELVFDEDGRLRLFCLAPAAPPHLQ